MTLFENIPNRRAEGRWITALVIGTLGVVGIGSYYFLGARDLGWIDVTMLFVMVSFAALGTMRTILGGILTGLAGYLATGLAASFYPVLTPYSRSFLNILGTVGLGGAPAGPGLSSARLDYPALALSFAALTVVLWIILELLFRASFEDTHLALLGPMDQVGGAVIYLAVGVLVAALLFSTIGYGLAGHPVYDEASLRPELNRVLELHYRGQSFWFAGRPPAIYVYDLDLS